MTDASWTQIVTTLYLVGNAFRLCAYLPQLHGLLRRRQVDGISVASWLAFAAGNVTTVIYAVHMHSSPLLVLCNVANLVASLSIVVLAAMRGGRRSLPRFYSASQVRPRSGRHRRCLGRRVDASFFDAVASHPRDAVRFQFRPFDLATVVGKRAARMEGAA